MEAYSEEACKKLATKVILQGVEDATAIVSKYNRKQKISHFLQKDIEEMERWVLSDNLKLWSLGLGLRENYVRDAMLALNHENSGRIKELLSLNRRKNETLPNKS